MKVFALTIAVILTLVLPVYAAEEVPSHPECTTQTLIASDNRLAAVDTFRDIWVLQKWVYFALANDTEVLVVYDLGQSHPCCHHPSNQVKIEIGDGVMENLVVYAESKFVRDAVPWGADCVSGKPVRQKPALVALKAGRYKAKLYLADAGLNCKFEIFECQRTRRVKIDIKPGSFPNSINLKNKGNVAVALFSEAGFDATKVDRNTVRFAGAAALAIGKSPEDINGDGLLDIVYHFDTPALQMFDGDTKACLTGQGPDGRKFEGCDSVRVLNGPTRPPKGAPPLSAKSKFTTTWGDIKAKY